MNTLKNKIQLLLKEKDISIYRLAEDINMAYSTAHRVVTNEYVDSIQISTLNKIANRLGVEVTDLFENNEEEANMLKKLAEKLMVMVNEELEEYGFIDDSDMTDRFLDIEARKLLEANMDDADKAYELTNDLVEEVKSLFTDNIKFAAYENNYVYYVTKVALREWAENILNNLKGERWSQDELDEFVEELAE